MGALAAGKLCYYIHKLDSVCYLIVECSKTYGNKITVLLKR